MKNKPDRIWSNKDKNKLRRYVLNASIKSFDFTEIAVRLGRSFHSVNVMATKQGWVKERKEKYKHLRQCSRCKNVFPASSYKKRNTRFGELHGKCNTCLSEHYEENKERLNEYSKKRRADGEKHQHDLFIQKKYKEMNREKVMFASIRNKSKKKGIEFDIELSDIIIPEFCPLIGIRLAYNAGFNNRDTSPSLDRIDSSKGYVKGNIWVISYRANRIKNDSTHEELSLIAKNLKKKISKRKA